MVFVVNGRNHLDKSKTVIFIHNFTLYIFIFQHILHYILCNITKINIITGMGSSFTSLHATATTAPPPAYAQYGLLERNIYFDSKIVDPTEQPGLHSEF